MKETLKYFSYFIFIFALAQSEERKCAGRLYDSDSIVCVCNATYCDSTPSPEKEVSSKYIVYTSNIAGLRFEKTSGIFLPSDLPLNKIYINCDKKYQEILGWGGAFSDSTGFNIAALKDNSTQENLLKSYFSSEGIEYDLCRVPIAGTDFSSRSYTYDDGPEDLELKNFTLQKEDLQYKIPFMKRAHDIRNGKLRFFAAAWFAPTWMIRPVDPYLGMIKTSMYQVWANYHCKFLEKYKEHGIQMWGITTGNEPILALLLSVEIRRLAWTLEQQIQWLGDYFGPTIRAKYPNINIMILDDQRYCLPWYAQFLVTNVTNKYIDGIALHWYYDTDLSDTLLDSTHAMWPDKFLLSTEGAILDGKAVILGCWTSGESYSTDIIQNCRNWVTGWVDWNMVLDLDGGPTWEHNNLDAPIIVNASAGEFYKQPMFYHFGHFSKFVPEGSVRIESSNDNENLQVVAFERPDGGVAVIIQNKYNKVIPVSIFDNRRGFAKIGLSKRSITTVLYW